MRETQNNPAKRDGDSRMRTRIGVTVVLALLLSAVSYASPAAAQLGDNTCITRAEFHAVHVGMTRHRTFTVIDYKGRVIWEILGSPDRQGRLFHQCGGTGRAEVDYRKDPAAWHVTAKSAHWTSS